MAQTNLSTVTLKTVANYRHAAERAVGAYRTGGHRLIAVMQKGVDQAAKRGAEPYVPGLADALRRAGDNMGSFALKGVDAVSDGTERVIVVSANGVATQVKRAASLAGGIDNRLVATGLKAAARISLPSAQVALALSERVAAGADKLATVAAGTPSAKARTKTKAVATRARRVAAKPAGRVLSKAVRDTTTEVKATTKAVRKAARRGAKVAVAKAEKAVAPVRAKVATKIAAKPTRRATRKAAPVTQPAAAAVAA